MTITELISSIKRKGQFPDDNYFSNTDYLSFLNDAMSTDIIPLLLKLNEEYFLESKEYTISSTKRLYRVPKRAVAAKLRDVKLKDASGGYINVQRIYEEDRANNLSGYYLNRNSIELSTNLLNSEQTLVLSYFASPNKLVLSSGCAQITSIDTNLNQVVVSALPSTIQTNSSIDFIQNSSPYDLLDFDINVSSVSGTTLSFSVLPEGLAVGDWVCVSCETPLPLISDELQPVLVQAALVHALSAKKDKSAEFETTRLKGMKDAYISMTDPRVESPDQKFRPNGLLTRMRFR